MAYAKNSTILASDLNGFLAQARAVYGVGSGDVGYGQTAVTQPDVVIGGPIKGSEWQNLRTMIASCLKHQNAGTLPSNFPPTTVFDPNQTVVAHESSAPSNNAYDLDSHLASIMTNRLLNPVASMTVAPNAWSVARNTTWSANISTTVDVSFGSENAARYFFNSGGQLRITMAHPNGSATQDTSWRTVLGTQVGMFVMSAHQNQNTGTANYSSGNVGFYELTSTPTTLLNGLNIGGGAYAANDVIITAQILNRTGVNGGNGSTVRFVVTLRDEHVNAAYDSVAAGTNVVFGNFRATTHLTGIVLPTYTTVTPL